MTIPFANMPRDADQVFADIQLMIPHCLARMQLQGTLRTALEAKIPAHVDLESCRVLVVKLLSDLDQWAATYPTLTRISWKDSPDSRPSGAGSEAAMKETNTSETPDTFISLMASNHMAARLILNMLMHKIECHSASTPTDQNSLNQAYIMKARECAVAILKGAADVEKSQALGFDMIRGLAPILVVFCTAPSSELRDSAKVLVDRWASKIGGLASIIQIL